MAVLGSITITAGGVKIPLTGHRYGAHRWREQLGLTPVLVEWRLPVGDAALVLAQKEVSITITPADGMGQPQTWQRIVVVGEGPSDDPEVRVVALSNTLWYLLRVHLVAAYNRRVYTGQNTLSDVGGQIPPAQPVNPIFGYALSTLRNDGSFAPSPWTAAALISDVLSRIKNLVSKTNAPFPLVYRDLSSLSSRGSWFPSDVLMDAPGNVALGQALGTVGGVDVRVAPDGALEVVDARLGAEKAVVQAACPYSLASGAGAGATPKGVMRWIANDHLAPPSFLVAYTRELEVRADWWERGGVPATPLTQYSTEDPWLEPVIRVVDLALPITPSPEGLGAYVPIAGVVLPVDQWFSAVASKNDAVNAPPEFAAISRQIVQQFYLCDVLYKLYADSPVDPLGPSAIWSQRLGVVLADYRNLFRLNPRFASRCVPGTIVPRRAALLNAATGERQPSPVWRDYYRKPTLRGLINQQRAGNQVESCPPLDNAQVFPVSGRSYSDTSFPDQPFTLDQAQTAPWVVGVEDPTLGYFRLTPRLLPGQEVSSVIPGLLAQPPGLDTYQIEQGSELPYFENCQLIATDRGALIFSAVPVGAAGEGQVQVYEVTAQQALARLGAPADAVTPRAPKQMLRVGDGVQRARVAWSDQNRAKILQAFGGLSTGDAQTGLEAGGPSTDLVPVNDAALKDYAIAEAAAWLAALLDHFEGTAEVGWSPGVHPVGSLQTVDFTVTATGELYTDLHCTHVSAPVNPMANVSQSTRNQIFGNLGGNA